MSKEFVILIMTHTIAIVGLSLLVAYQFGILLQHKLDIHILTKELNHHKQFKSCKENKEKKS
jgi:hypothetical protein